MVQPEKGPKVSTRNLRQHRTVISEGNPIGAASTLKVLDFSADNDHERDSNGEWTIATLEAGFLPESLHSKKSHSNHGFVHIYFKSIKVLFTQSN